MSYRSATAMLTTGLLASGALLLWIATGDSNATPNPQPAIMPASSSSTRAPASLPEAPTVIPVPEKTREEKRFARADRNDDGLIQLEEYLSTRRRNFNRLDANGDGKLSFEEYAKAGFDKFHGADEDGNGVLNAVEFATLAPKRRAPVKKAAECNCEQQENIG